MENQFVAIFIASDLLLFFYLSLLYTLCLNIFLFPVCAAFCSFPGIFSVHFFFPCSLPIPHPRPAESLRPFLVWVPRPLPRPFCAHPASCLAALLSPAGCVTGTAGAASPAVLLLGVPSSCTHRLSQ